MDLSCWSFSSMYRTFSSLQLSVIAVFWLNNWYVEVPLCQNYWITLVKSRCRCELLNHTISQKQLSLWTIESHKLWTIESHKHFSRWPERCWKKEWWRTWPGSWIKGAGFPCWSSLPGWLAIPPVRHHTKNVALSVRHSGHGTWLCGELHLLVS